MRHLTSLAAAIPVLMIPAVGFLAPAAVASDPRPARDLVALEEDGLLVFFRSDDPGTVRSTLRVFHWPPEAGEIALMTVATRPATGEIYGLSRALQLVKIDAASGAVVVVGPRIDSAIQGIGSQYMWMDFDPVRDVVRVLDERGRQIRLDPDTGVVIDGAPGTAGVQSDADWHWADGDTGADGTTIAAPSAFAYAADSTDATRATAYGIVGTLSGNVLVRIGDPGDPASVDRGEVHTVAQLGAFPGGGLAPYGFTVADGAAFVELKDPYHAGAYVLNVDLATGALSPLPDFSQGAQSPEPEMKIGLPGKANFNALAWLPPNGASPPAPPPPAAPRVRVNRGRLQFHRLRHPADVVRLHGRIALDDVLRTGDAIRFDLGSVTQTFQLDGRLRGAAGEDRLRFAAGRGSEVRFELRLRAEDLSAELVVPRRGAHLTLPISVAVNGDDAVGSVALVVRTVTTARAVAVVRR